MRKLGAPLCGSTLLVMVVLAQVLDRSANLDKLPQPQVSRAAGGVLFCSFSSEQIMGVINTPSLLSVPDSASQWIDKARPLPYGWGHI